jgi:two-component system phosphate regulon sensor histidine kinase PhoR
MANDMNQLLSAVLATMREGIIIVNSNMDIVLYNDAAMRIVNLPGGTSASHLGVNETEAASSTPTVYSNFSSLHLNVEEGRRAMRPLRLVDATRDPTINDAFRRTLNEGIAIDERVELACRSYRVYQLNVIPLRNNLAIGVFFDITQLERLERIRREFFANLSHELRTPLTAILAYTETLSSGAIDDRENSRRFVEKLHKHAMRMNELISDISDLSAIESGKVQLAPGPVRLRNVVTGVIALTDARRKNGGVSFNVAVPESLFVRADRTRLEQILNNLIDNAVKFNRPGGSVTVTAEERGREVAIIVEDTGVGIAASDLPRIFERLYRADKSRSRKVEGTGLGLAIVKHLVQAHGGDVTAESEVGRGSRFIIALPAAVKEVRTDNEIIPEMSSLDV